MAPMDNRLLRPRASGLFLPSDADARAYVLAVNAADGQPLEKPVAEAIDAFVIGCKADNIWNAIKASCILMGARTLSGALTPLKGGAPTNVNNNFVSGDYNRETGLIGDGTSKYLDSNLNNNAQAVDSHHLSFYASTADAGTGVYAGVGTGDLILRGSTQNFRSRSVTANLDNTGFAGFQGISRSSTTAWIARGDGGNVIGGGNAVTPFNASIFVFCRNNSGPQLYSSARLAFYSIGDSLDLALLDTRVTNLYNAIGAAI
jgi:hypothetical protein